MKLLYYLIVVCGLAFFESFVSGDFNQLNEDDVVGVSQKNLQEYITKAFKGFKNVMLKGDEEFNYPIMEPYKLEDISWDYLETGTSGGSKHSLKFTNNNEFKIHGLSNYNIKRVKVNARDLKLNFDLSFLNLRTEIPYKLDGYVFKGIMPVYGEGLLKLSAPVQEFMVEIGLGIEKGFIMLENLYIRRRNYDIKATVGGLMDLPDKFANYVLDDILDNIVKNHGE